MDYVCASRLNVWCLHSIITFFRSMFNCFFQAPRHICNFKQNWNYQYDSETRQNQGWKRWFLKVLVLLVFKNLERSNFLFFNGFFRYLFSYKFCAQTIVIIFLIIILFLIYMNLHSLYSLPPNFTSVISYSALRVVVFSGYFLTFYIKTLKPKYLF